MSSNVKSKNEIKPIKTIVKKFRERLETNGQSLKWWHNTYISEMYEYNYFIRQLNELGAMKPDLLEALRDYISITI